MTVSHVEIGGAQALLAEAGRQAPFALALALTSIAKDAQGVVQRSLPSTFDQPTPFTMQAIGIVAATKAVPVAQVFVKDDQAKYLELQATGGERKPLPGAPVITPVQIGTNVYGNIPKGALRRERGKRTTFAAPAGGDLPPGIYRRTGRKGRGGLKLLAALLPRAQYERRFPFAETVIETVKRVAPGRLREALDRALATARK